MYLSTGYIHFAKFKECTYFKKYFLGIFHEGSNIKKKLPYICLF